MADYITYLHGLSTYLIPTMIHDEVRQGIFRGFKFKMKALILIAEKEVIAWCEIKKISFCMKFAWI